MKSFKSRSFTFFLLFFILPLVLIFTYFYIYYKVTYDIEKILLNFKKNFVIYSSIRSSLNMFVYIMFFYIILNFNLFNSYDIIKSKYENINSKSIYNSFFLTFSLLFFFIFLSNEFFIPVLTSKIEKMRLTTKLSYTYLKLAKEAEKKKNFAKSIDYYQKYLFFEPSNQAIAEKIADLKRERYIYKDKKEEKVNKNSKVDVQGLYSKGVYYFNRKEYLLSAYYLEKYLQLITTDQKAKDLYKRAIELYEKNKAKVNKINKEKLELKAKGIEYLKHNKYIEAYRIFLYLKKKYPSDKSILGYYLEAKKLYSKLDFLIERAVELKNFPGIFNIVYIIKDEKDRKIIFYTQKIVNYFNEIYFYNIKLYDIGKKKLYYYKYGKQVGDYLIVKNVEYQNKKFKDNFDYNKLSKLFLIESKKHFSLPFYFSSIKYYKNIGYNVNIIEESLISRISFYFILILYSIGLFIYSVKTRLKINEFPSLIHIVYYLFSIYIIIHPLYFYINGFMFKFGMFLKTLINLNVSVISLVVLTTLIFVLEIKSVIRSIE